MNEQSEKKQTQKKPFFQLVQAVGTSGRYQTLILTLSILLCLQNGMISLSTSYMFAVAPYSECPEPYKGIPKCTKYVCSLSHNQRYQYEDQQIRQLKTLGNQFGDYHCQNVDAVSGAKGMYFIGAIAGFFVFGMMSDNVGRRLSLVFCLAVGVIGYAVMLLAQTLFIAGIGYLLVGFSVESSFNLVFCLLSEMMENDQRQKMQTFIQAWMPIGGMLIVLAFYLMKEWKIILFLFCFIPYVICFIATYALVVETPQFLVKRFEVQEIRQNLRFIAWLNSKEQEFDSNIHLSENHIANLKAEHCQELKDKHSVPFTFFDFFRYPSLRMITICCTLLFFGNNFLYNAPSMLVDQFGFDFYLNSIILYSSELCTYFFSYFTITELKRRSLNIVSSIVCLAASFCLIFLHTNKVCDEFDCNKSKIAAQLIFIFILRFAVSLQFQVLFLYVAQLFPVQVGGMALGLSCIVGHIANVFLPELITLLNRANFPITIIFTMVSLLNLINSAISPQTSGEQPKQLVEELRYIHHEDKQDINYFPVQQGQAY